jgi:hypothetical protein
MTYLFLPNAALVVFLAAPAAAQSLAELATREEARRKAIENPTRVYTNADLKGANPLAPPSPPGPAAAPPASGAPASPPDKTTVPALAPPTSTASSRAEADGEVPPRDEAWWRQRMVALQEDLARKKTYIDALQSRINALTTDFVNRDDPYQRAGIERDRLAAIAELERLKSEVAEQSKAVGALQEEARRAGVPPGWLR